MALRNTSERYDYIYENYGNTVKKLKDNTADNMKGNAVHKKQSAAKPKYTENARKLTTQDKEASERIQRNRARFLAFDWKYTLVALVAVVICASAAMFYLHATVQLNVMEQKISELKTEKTTLLSKQSALQSEIDKSINLDEIKAYAEKNLHMITPKDSNILLYRGENYDYFRQYESVD